MMAAITGLLMSLSNHWFTQFSSDLAEKFRLYIYCVPSLWIRSCGPQGVLAFPHGFFTV